MFQLDKTIKDLKFYNIQKDFILKIFIFFFPTILYLSLLRAQVPEVNILQLIPGSYIFFLFAFLSFFLLFGEFSFRNPINFDSRKKIGLKTLKKQQIFLILKIEYSFVAFFFFISVILFLPLSLESLNSYSEVALENIWSFDQVLGIEFSLLAAFFIISQLPRQSFSYFTVENDIFLLPEYWKLLIFFCFIIAGAITPTVDVFTQFLLAFTGIFIYFSIFFFLKKRLLFKLYGLVPLQ